MSSKVIQETEKLIMPILKENDMELVDIEYVKEGPNWFLRVYIDKEGGPDISDCGEVSEQLSEKLDETDPIKGAYFLEVSSPGAERPLKTKADFTKNINNNVYITLYEPLNGEKAYEGVLRSFQDDMVKMEYLVKGRKKVIEIPYGKIAKARLAIVF
ncbi:MAG TPA: ribosome maturation factor RimP [Bacillota bacterium]|nr:ribosome maturation factor RimP [Bacillota bacterium]